MNAPPPGSVFRRLCSALLPVIAVASLALAAPTVHALDLGRAPVREGSVQPLPQWRLDTVPKAALTRAAVVALYQGVYVPGKAAFLAWTGSVAACDAGTTNIEHQQAVITRVNYYRALAGLPPVALLAGTETVQAQAAALMMSANTALSHTPPSSWACYSMTGAAGASSSNLSLGANGVAAIDGYMDDAGPGNVGAGHRRWILYPPQGAMGTGDISGGNAPPRPSNALYVLGPQTTRPATPNGVAWPPAGFVPYQNLPARSNRWSLSYPGADFSKAAVTMTGPGGPVPVTTEPVTPPFGSNRYIGDHTLVFLPVGVSYQKPASDTTYTITVAGIGGAGVPSSIQYTVTVIDPDASVPVAATATVVEYYNASLDHYFITWLPEEIADLDAGRTPTRWLRTGYTFETFTTAQPGTSPVCRFYIPPDKGDSHFFGRGAQECDDTGAKNPSFVLEDSSFMHMYLPLAGECPAGTVPIYRVFSNRPDANHRYTADRSVRDAMAGLGWLAEGDGPDQVVMCAPS